DVRLEEQGARAVARLARKARRMSAGRSRVRRGSGESQRPADAIVPEGRAHRTRRAAQGREILGRGIEGVDTGRLGELEQGGLAELVGGDRGRAEVEGPKGHLGSIEGDLPGAARKARLLDAAGRERELDGL